MSLKKGIMYVFFANIINLIISLFTGFVLPKILSVETYAHIKLFQLYISYIGIMHLGFADGMYLRIGGKSLAELDKKEVLSEFKTFKIFQLIVSLFSIIISIIIKNKILFFCTLVIFPINISNYVRSFYQAIGQFKKYSKYTNINTILIFIVNIILLFIIKTDNDVYYVVAYIVAYILYWIIIELQIRKLLGEENSNRASKKYLIQDIKLGFLFLVGNFCNVIFTSIDRIFVKNLLGIVQFAFYSFAVSVENLMNVFITPISTVMYNYFCTHKEKSDIVKVKKYIMLFASVIVIVIFPVKFIVQTWLTKYEKSIIVLFVLFAAQYISIMIKCVHLNLYKAEKKQNKYFGIMINIVLISILLNSIAYQFSHTIIAIAIATLITNIVWFIVGELEFKKYRLNIGDYIYITIILIEFLLCSLVSNAIIGFFIYFIVTVIITFVFEKDNVFRIIKKVKIFTKEYIKNKKHSL